MTKKDKKIISVILLIIILLFQIVPVFADDVTEQEELKTLTQYLIENGVDTDGDNEISTEEWAKVKNLKLKNINIAGIEYAVNLRSLEIENCNIEREHNIGKLEKLEDLTIINCEAKIDFSQMDNLSNIYFSGVTLEENTNLEDIQNLYGAVLEDCTNYTNIDFNKLSKLNYLDIYGKDSNYNGEDILNLENLENLEELNLLIDDTKVKLPQFKNINEISLNTPYYWNNASEVVNLNALTDIDLTNFNGEKGEISIDNYEKITFNSNTFITNVFDDVGVYAFKYIEDEIKIYKDCSFQLALISGNHDIELVSNTNENVAELSQKDYYYNIVAKNVGTTTIKLKDAFGREKEVEVTVYDTPENEVDTTLEDKEITSRFVGANINHVLKSNGELWKINSGTTAEKVETNVKNYINDRVYDKSGEEVYVEELLKNDNTLTIRYGESEKIILNVKEMADNIYLTNDGDLYEIGLNYITEEINPKLIKHDVKRVIDECIVLNDNTTWYQNYSFEKYFHNTSGVTFTKLADFEIKDMEYQNYPNGNYGAYQMIPTVIDNDNNLWCCKTKEYFFNNSGLEIWKSNFEGYGLPVYENDVSCSGIDGIKITDDGKAVLKNDSNKEVLTEISQIAYNNNIYYPMLGWVFIRKDGTIWMYSYEKGLSKITESTSLEEEDDDEDFLNIENEINIKKVENEDVISGIKVNENIAMSVQEFIEQNNFNSRYGVKVYDSNGNEMANDELLGTGSKVKLIKNGQVIKEYTVVIYGDTTGDGEITAIDALAIVKYINGKYTFEEAYIEAGRVRSTSETSLTAVDALAIIKGINGKFTISQEK